MISREESQIIALNVLYLHLNFVSYLSANPSMPVGKRDLISWNVFRFKLHLIE